VHPDMQSPASLNTHTCTARVHCPPVGLQIAWCNRCKLCRPCAPKPKTLRRARNAAKAKAGDRRSQVQEVRDAAGVTGPDAAKLQVCPCSRRLHRVACAVNLVKNV
jgi:hypothetical protein